MKILIVNSFSEASDGGGLSLVALELAQKLAEKGEECTLVLPGEKVEAHINESGLIKFSIPSFGNVSLILPLLDDKNVKKLFQYLDGFRPDVIHIHNQAILEAIVLFWAVQHQVPVVYTLHLLPSQVADFLPNVKQGKIPIYLQKTGLIDLWVNVFMKFCSVGIALNSSTEKEFKIYKFPGRIFKIQNGRNMSKLFEIKHKYTEGKATVKLLFMGSNCERKNQFFLIEMMKFLPSNYSLTLIGNFENDLNYHKKMLSAIQTYDLTDRVEILGKIPFANVVENLATHHLFVSASKAEVQSLAVLEALGAGMPIVALPNQTTTELLDGNNGLLMPVKTNSEEFAEKVVELAINIDRQRTMNECARVTAKRFDWGPVVDLTIQAYKETISDFNRTPKPVLNKRLKKFLAFLDMEYNPKATTLKKKHAKKKSDPLLWVFTGTAMATSVVMLLNWKLINLLKKKTRKA